MNNIFKSATAIIAIIVSLGSTASSGVSLDAANTDINDKASLQNGAKLFMNYCSGCHSLQFLRYNKFTEDLAIPKNYVVENLMFNGEKTGDTITSSMPPDGATRWFGGVPPDLSLVARYKGTDWIYSYLRSFYPDSSRPFGVNNRVFKNVSMPDILWHLKLSSTEKEFDDSVRDIVNFLDYVGEPSKLISPTIGFKVLGFLLVLLILTFLLKKEYWKDVKYGKWRVKS